MKNRILSDRIKTEINLFENVLFTKFLIKVTNCIFNLYGDEAGGDVVT